MNQWIDLEIANKDDLKEFILKYVETHEKYVICINKAKNFKSKEEDLLKRFEDIMKINLLKFSKMRLIVANLCYENFELVTKLSSVINIEGIIIKKR